MPTENLTYFCTLAATLEPEVKKEMGYFCPDCQTHLDLTGIALLRHQRKHQQDKENA